MQRLQRLLAWDEALLVAVSRRQRPLATKTFRAITHLGDGTSLTFLGLVLLLAGNTNLAWRLGLATGAATVVSQLLKRVLKRRRPNVGIAGFNALVQNPDAFSFPSGHTAAAVALAVAWAGEGSSLGLFASCFAATVACSRVYLGAHYPLDVMAGATIGIVTGACARIPFA